jgi:hypothetical protein
MNAHIIEPQAFKLEDACKYLGGISASSVRRLVAKKKLKRLMEFRHLVITKSSCDKFLQES